MQSLRHRDDSDGILLPVRTGMQRSTATFLLFAAVLGGAAALLWSTAETDEPPAPQAPQQRSVEVASNRGQDPPLPPSSSALRVRVEVQSRERYLPPPAARVQAVRAGDGTELPTFLLAGVGAGFDAPSRNAGIAIAMIDFEGVRLVRQVEVGEAVTRPIVGSRIVARGRVRNPTQQPIVGARVWLGEQDAEGNPREVRTDDDGAFELDTPSGDGVPFVVRADGGAAMWRVVTVASPGPDLQAIVQPGGVLEVQLAAPATDIHTARVFVVPRGAVSTELAQFPFFLQALSDGFAVDGNGRASIGDLPTSGEVGIVVRHAQAPGMAPHAATLKGKHTRAIVPLQFAPTTWSARVVDPTGQPIVGVTVWSRQPRQDMGDAGSLRLLPPHLGTIGVCASRTSDDGTFVLGGLANGDAVLSLRAYGCAGRDMAWAELVAGTALVLPPWHGGAAAFRLLPPVAGAAWVAETDLAGGIRADVAADQPWEVSFPHAGRFDVVVTTFVGDMQRGSTSFRDVLATGCVDLRAPRPE